MAHLFAHKGEDPIKDSTEYDHSSQASGVFRGGICDDIKQLVLTNDISQKHI